MDMGLQGIKANPLNLNVAKSCEYHSSVSCFMLLWDFNLDIRVLYGGASRNTQGAVDAFVASSRALDGCFLLMKGWIYKHFSPHETNGLFRNT